MITNCFAPAFVFISGISSSGKNLIKLLGTEIKSPLTVANLTAIIFSFFYLIFGSIYIRKSFTFNRASQHYYSYDSKNIKNLNLLMKGILFYSLSFVVMLGFATTSIVKEFPAKPAFYISSYVFTGVSAILSLLSNICLYSYEWKKYFQVYYPRYKNNEIPEVFKNMEIRKKIRASNGARRYQ